MLDEEQEAKKLILSKQINIMNLADKVDRVEKK
jgi:hypothetical protein